MLARQLRVEVANLMDSLVETGAKSPTDGLVSPTSVAVAMMHRRPPSSDTMHRGRTFKSPTILADGCCATTATKECDALPVDQSKRRALTATKALTVSLKAESAEPSGMKACFSPTDELLSPTSAALDALSVRPRRSRKGQVRPFERNESHGAAGSKSNEIWSLLMLPPPPQLSGPLIGG